jgi:hypothetical protein
MKGDIEMAKWMRTLDIVNEWEQAQEYELAPQELAAIIAERLNNLQNFNDSMIDGIKSHLVEEFKHFSQSEYLDDNDFNKLMNNLYNWADISLDSKFGGKKVCWIKIF